MNETLIKAIKNYNKVETMNTLATKPMIESIDQFNYSDFYIGIFLNLMDIVKNIENLTKDSFNELKNIASTLQKLAFHEDIAHNVGININDTLLLSSSIYAIIGYKMQSYVLSKMIDDKQIISKTSSFIKAFLVNRYDGTEFARIIRKYYLDNDIDSINEFIKKFDQKISSGISLDPNEYVKSKIISYMLKHISSVNPWILLNNGNLDNKSVWKKFFKIYLKNRIRYDMSLFQRFIFDDFLKSQYSKVINFSNEEEQQDVANAVIYKHLYSEKRNRVLYVVNKTENIQEIFFELFIDKFNIFSLNETFINSSITVVTYELLDKFIILDDYNYTLVVFTDISIIRELNKGIIYEYYIGKYLKNISKHSKVLFFDNSIHRFNIESKHIADDQLNNIDINRLVNCFVSINNKELSTEINTSQFEKITNDVFNQQIVYKKNGKNKKVTYTKTTRNYNKSCNIALQLISKGHRVNLITAQTYHKNYGVYKLAYAFNDMVEETNFDIIDYDEDFEIIEKEFTIYFGKDSILTKLMKYGVILFFHGLPAILKNMLLQIIKKDSIRMVISNYSFSLTEEFKEFDSIVIHMIRINTVTYNSYWPQIDIDDIKAVIRRFLDDKKSTNKYVYLHNEPDIIQYKKAISVIENCNLISDLQNLIHRIDNGQEMEELDSLFSGLDTVVIDSLIDGPKDVDLSKIFFYSSKSIKVKKINQLFNERKKANPYCDNVNKLRKIKKIGGNFTLYNVFEKVISEHEENLSDMRINELLFDVIAANPESKIRINYINEKYFSKMELDIKSLKQITKVWIEGYNYWEIRKKFDSEKLTIETLLLVINYFIEDYLVIVFESLLNYLETNKFQLKKQIEKYKKILPCYKLGCNNLVSIQLYKIGVNDREINKIIKNYIYENNLKFDKEYDLKKYLINNWDKITINLHSYCGREYIDNYIKYIN